MTTPTKTITPDVTVTVIVYNDAGRLPRAVASVLDQTHGNIEVVISDDHSTDATPEVARRLAARTRACATCVCRRTAAGAARPATARSTSPAPRI